MNDNINFTQFSKQYIEKLGEVFTNELIDEIENLAKNLLNVWETKKNVFICGNGGSGANAIHMANDFHFGVGACGDPPIINGIKVEALTANAGVITCLANDIGYENIFSHQIETKAKEGDLLIVLSGSGNSENICKALEKSSEIGVKSFAILGYEGGKCLKLADNPIHFPIQDMQIAEDTQLIVGHICMQWLTKNKPKSL